MAKYLLVLAILLRSLIPVFSQVYENEILDDNIKSVQFYLSGGAGDQIDYPIKPLNSRNPIRLEFDWLGEEMPYFTAKLVHCDFD